jgi:putative sigma-54 modulation protein
MRIEIRGRNVAITDELREHVHKRFARIGRQVSDLARLEVELMEERNPSIRDGQICEAHLHLKGVVLTATECAPEMLPAIKACSLDITRQVKRNRERRRRRWQSRRFSARLRGRAA